MNIKQFSEQEQAFLTALKYFNDKCFKGHQKKLADLGDISNGYLSELLGFKKICKPIKQESLANACGYSLKEFIKIGEKILSVENKKNAKAIVEAAESITNPIYYRYQKIAENSLKKFQKEIEKITVKSINTITSQGQSEQSHGLKKNDIETYKTEKNKKHHHKINEFNDQATAMSINSKLVEIEKLDPDMLSKIDRMMQIELDSLMKKKGLIKPSVPGESKKRTT